MLAVVGTITALIPEAESWTFRGLMNVKVFGSGDAVIPSMFESVTVVPEMLVIVAWLFEVPTAAAKGAEIENLSPAELLEVATALDAFVNVRSTLLPFKATDATVESAGIPFPVTGLPTKVCK